MKKRKGFLRRLVRRALGLISPMPVFEISMQLGQVPYRGSNESAGLDLIATRRVTIPPGKTLIIPTGVKCRFNPGWVALIWDRSGNAVKGMHCFAGVIDSDYRGTWGVVMHNTTSKDIEIHPLDRVAQVVFQRCWIGWPRMGVVRTDTDRGTGGFGSTNSTKETP